MASPLQNRIVGSVILIALAVIILPDILDGQKAQPQRGFDTIPLQPEMNSAEVEVQLPTWEVDTSAPNQEVVADAENAPTMKAADAHQTDVFETMPEPETVEIGAPAWVIQLGVFSNEASVDRLVKQLQQAGYPAYAEPITGRDLTKVMVGPDSSKARLEAQLNKLKQLTELSGKVLQHSPGER